MKVTAFGLLLQFVKEFTCIFELFAGLPGEKGDKGAIGHGGEGPRGIQGPTGQ